MTRHVRSLALIAAAAVGLAGFARAQEGSKMGIVNTQLVVERSVEGKKAIAQLQAADKKYSDQVTQLDEQIKQLQNRLSTQRLTLTQEAAAGIQADIQRKQTDRQRTAEDASRSMQDLQASLLMRIQNEVIPIIEQVRKDKGFDLIFDLNRSGTVYFNPALDMTDEVVRRYDAAKAVTPAPPVKK